MIIKDKLNFYGKQKEPCFFVIDFDLNNHHIVALKDLDDDILFSIDKKNQKIKNRKKAYSFKPIKFEIYKKAFDTLQTHIQNGDSYLTNLTAPSTLNIDYSLKEIYQYTDAKFKLYFKNQFICFSPERFIEIKNSKIYTYPMKGTIDANIKNAKEKILNNKKEMAEHVMVVDLLRNDLSMVAKKVRVKKFRYIEKIKAGERELLQVSSKIEGELEENWQNRLGDIITKLLPAGSITGTPKKRTTQIIKEIENYNRGFFSGIFGIFDGESLDSSVMIRFIEQQNSKLIYKSGGGITIDSSAKEEYQEMCEKIYVPFF